MSRRVPVVRGGRLAAANRLDELRAAGDTLMQLETQVMVARDRVQKLVFEAYTVDRTPPSKIGGALGISRQRVRQIVLKVREKGAPK